MILPGSRRPADRAAVAGHLSGLCGRSGDLAASALPSRRRCMRLHISRSRSHSRADVRRHGAASRGSPLPAANSRSVDRPPSKLRDRRRLVVACAKQKFLGGCALRRTANLHRRGVRRLRCPRPEPDELPPSSLRVRVAPTPEWLTCGRGRLLPRVNDVEAARHDPREHSERRRVDHPNLARFAIATRAASAPSAARCPVSAASNRAIVADALIRRYGEHRGSAVARRFALALSFVLNYEECAEHAARSRRVVRSSCTSGRRAADLRTENLKHRVEFGTAAERVLAGASIFTVHGRH